MSSRTPRLHDIVLLQQGIAVVRYYGNVEWDTDTPYFGVELKGPSISGGHNGAYNGKKYFSTTGGDGRGIFVKQSNILRVISSEEILEKLAEIYDILKGRKGHSHFIDRQRYDDLAHSHQSLVEQYKSKVNEVNDLSQDLAILKEQIAMMKGTLGDKIDETAKMSAKINKAEKKIGSRLSRINMDEIKNRLYQERNDIEKPIEIPDYSQSTQTAKNSKSHHTKQRSSMTIELDQLDDDFSDIAKTVQAYGQKNMDISGPTHYRRFSNTTKQILEEHKKAGQEIGTYSNGMNGHSHTQQRPAKGTGHRARDSMKIGDITDGDGIDYDSDEQQKLERESENEDSDNDNGSNGQRKRKVTTRASRESRVIPDEQIYKEEHEVKERESNEEEETEDQTQRKRKPKNRASRESRVIEDVEVEYVPVDDDAPPKRGKKTRQSRQSRQMDDEDLDNLGSEEEAFEEVTDDVMGNNMQIEASNGKKVKRNKARGSFQVDQPVLSAAMLETHNEHHLEEEAGQINGPKDSHAHKHKKNESITSNSSAYRAFMSVD